MVDVAGLPENLQLKIMGLVVGPPPAAPSAPAPPAAAAAPADADCAGLLSRYAAHGYGWQDGFVAPSTTAELRRLCESAKPALTQAGVSSKDTHRTDQAARGVPFLHGTCRHGSPCCAARVRMPAGVLFEITRAISMPPSSAAPSASRIGWSDEPRVEPSTPTHTDGVPRGADACSASMCATRERTRAEVPMSLRWKSCPSIDAT